MTGYVLAIILAAFGVPVLAAVLWVVIHLLPSSFRKKVMRFIDGE